MKTQQEIQTEINQQLVQFNSLLTQSLQQVSTIKFSLALGRLAEVSPLLEALARFNWVVSEEVELVGASVEDALVEEYVEENFKENSDSITEQEEINKETKGE